MGLKFLSNIGKSIGEKIAANTVDKFHEYVNSISADTTDNMVMASVTSQVPDGRNGVSYATDILKRMSDIEWSRGYSWDVYITPPPKAPFDQTKYGLPVVEVQSDFSLMGESVDLPLANSTYRAPIRKNFFDIKLVLLDSYNGVMETYFEEWMDKIYSWDGSKYLNGKINYLDQCVRTIRITKLTSTKKELFTREYLVYPEANMSSFDNSTGAVRTFTVNLVIAGYNGKTYSHSVASSSSASIPATEYGTLIDAVKSATSPTDSAGGKRWNRYLKDSKLNILNSQNTRSDSELMQQLKGISGTFYGSGSSLPNKI